MWPLVLTGVGQGLFMTPNALALMNAAPASQQGESSGLLATGRVLGQCLSIALAGAIFVNLGGAEAGRTLLEAKTNHLGVEGEISALQLSFLSGFHTALLVCASVAAAGIFAALIRGAETEATWHPLCKRGNSAHGSATSLQ
jgi:hypothetical protein